MAQTRTPTLTKNSYNSIQFVSNHASFTQKEIELYQNGIALPTHILYSNAQGYSIDDLSPAIYKAKVKVEGLDWSEFSNEIDLTTTSQEPIVTTTGNLTLDNAGNATFTGTGISGATIKCYNATTNTVAYTATVASDGSWSIVVSAAGNYAFTQTETGKTESLTGSVYRVNSPTTTLPNSAIPVVTSTSGSTVGTVINGTCTGAGTIKIYRGSYGGTGAEWTTVTTTSSAWSWTPNASEFGDWFFTYTAANSNESEPTATAFSVIKATAPTPSLSGTSFLVGDSVTIANSSNFDGYLIYKGSSIAVEGTDIQVITLVGVNDTFKFLAAGSYTIKGQKQGYNTSNASAVITVTQAQAAIYTVVIKNLCGATTSRIQVGFADTLANVTNWYEIVSSGTVATGENEGYPFVTIQSNEVIGTNTKFFIRDRENPTNISAGVSLS